jgi:hypothetical protein
MIHQIDPSPSVALAFEDSGSKGGSDEVTIVVGRRKNSTTKAVRYRQIRSRFSAPPPLFAAENSFFRKISSHIFPRENFTRKKA